LRSVLTLDSRSLDETQRIGMLLGKLVQRGDVILLHGTLGAGKTAFAQGLGAGLGVTGTINSPTFTILKEYHGRLPLYHFDLYRIEEPEELVSLGFEDYFDGDGVCVVEWAERGEADGQGLVWPEDYVRIRFEIASPEERTLHISADGMRGDELLSELANVTEKQEGA
jgi:tRNA threonylcarbamoyladenosine biosynthesis protein TsaE